MKIRQDSRRAELFSAHQKTIDWLWDDHGTFIADPYEPLDSYRLILWHCLAYLAGDARCVEKANRIILRNYTQKPCHFTPGAAVDLLWHYPDKLGAEARTLLERYLTLNIQHSSTPDLQIWGYNDNHPYKAFHVLIVGGEMFGLPGYVEHGVRRLREAVESLGRNGLPCEYNSPTYTPVSLQPLAGIVEQAKNAEARELALQLEQFYWRDVALHFDARAGVPAGPHSRAYVDGYTGLLSNLLGLLMYLFPDRFDTDLIAAAYAPPETNDLLDPVTRRHYPKWLAHHAWLARADWHLTPELEEAIFDKPAGAGVRGMAETGSWSINWKPEEKPEGAPSTMHLGPRRSLCTTYFGKRYSLGTAQFSWLNNAQADGFYATVARGSGRDPRQAAVYFSRMFFDERSPYGEKPFGSNSFHDDGDIRCVQHENTAIVLYNPLPLFGTFKRLRLGIYRPLLFSRPEELWVGTTPVPSLNHLGGNMERVAIRDGEVYIGIIPLRLTDHGQARAAHLHVHTYSDRLAILMSSFEGWGPRTFSFDDIVAINAGFVCEMRDAGEFTSFSEFRDWLAAAQVEDAYDLSHRRLTTYRRAGLTLSARYSPFQTGFQHATVNGQMVEMPRIAVDGIPDPVDNDARTTLSGSNP